MRPSLINILFFIVSLAVFNNNNLRSVHGFVTTTEKDKEFDVIPNPYDVDNVCHPNLEQVLEPYYLLTKPIPTQPDTFQELSYAKIMSVPVPIYRMKQPARISESQLEFQLVLVKDLSKVGKSTIQAITVDFDKAKDSWFPGYYWSPLVMSCGEGSFRHVGWKFTALDDNSNPVQQFYALMVHINDKSKGNVVEIRIGGFKAPGWMASRYTI